LLVYRLSSQVASLAYIVGFMGFISQHCLPELYGAAV
jgi:hypothetical protein